MRRAEKLLQRLAINLEIGCIVVGALLTFGVAVLVVAFLIVGFMFLMTGM